MIDVSIIVPTLNRGANLQTALNSFIKQDFSKEYYEILVVDNGSTDNTRAVVDEIIVGNPEVNLSYLFEPVPGLLSGRHRGAQAARGDILVFVDDDIEADTAWLSAIFQVFQNPATHLAGGPSLPRFETEPPKWMEKFFQYRNGRLMCGDLSLLDIGDTLVNIDPTYVWGLNYAIRKQTLFELGGFHPDCIPKHLQQYQGDGETGLSLKIRQKKLGAVYVPAAKVYHHISKDRLTVRYFENRYFYQGVCDSYTQIRGKGGIETITPPEYPEKPADGSGVSLYDRYREIIYLRISNAYVEGFRFHYNAVKADRRLLAWVLKEDYFDYRLPGTGNDQVTTGGKGRPTAAASTPTVPADERKPGTAKSGEAGPPASNTDKPLPAKIAKQIAVFKNSPVSERQSHMDRTQNPGENLAYYAKLKERLKSADVPVREVPIDRADFDHWRKQVPEIVSFYRPSGDVFIEKCLEHYLVDQHLDLNAGDTYVDVAASGSPWAGVLNKHRIKSYRLDRAYRPGVNGMNIGADAADTGLPDNFCNGLSLQCAYECFEGDADVRFVKEASRLLVPGGKYAIVPLYLESEFFITTSPLIDQDEVVLDPGAKRVWRDDNYVEPFSRMYSPEVFKERIYRQIPSDTRAEILYFQNLGDIMQYYRGQRIYCFFMLLGQKSGEMA